MSGRTRNPPSSRKAAGAKSSSTDIASKLDFTHRKSTPLRVSAKKDLVQPKRQRSVDDVVVVVEEEAHKKVKADVSEHAPDALPDHIRALVENKPAALQFLKSFDLNLEYGPCVGLSRLERWNRAQKLELAPPVDVLALLQTKEVRNDVELREPLWHDVL
ncbi:hypothetical protein HKX48_001759 [Thoreauomyces humboldtii]|nr:hypothetical protein HKX48_001759 [Thoreauomyces humboldtii]